jgi:hypothetical protein
MDVVEVLTSSLDRVIVVLVALSKLPLVRAAASQAVPLHFRVVLALHLRVVRYLFHLVVQVRVEQVELFHLQAVHRALKAQVQLHSPPVMLLTVQVVASV